MVEIRSNPWLKEVFDISGSGWWCKEKGREGEIKRGSDREKKELMNS